MPRLVAALLALTACLDAPPGQVDGDPADAAAPACTGLDAFVESFEETAAEATFLDLWDPGTADYDIQDGALGLYASGGESQINSRDGWERTGDLRVGPLLLAEVGSASISVYDAAGTTRITISPSTIDLYHLSAYMPLDRDPADRMFAIGFAGGMVTFSAAEDGSSWRPLWAVDADTAGEARVALAVRNLVGPTMVTVLGINTPETGAPCP